MLLCALQDKEMPD